MESIGKYELVRKVAAGGMAEIYLARQLGPAGFVRQLVLKTILPELSQDQEFVSMFLDEARLAAQLTHPNIAQIHDFGEADGTYYLAMELVRGPNLKRLAWYAHKKGLPMPFEIAAKLVAQACEGLDYAHRLLGADGAPLGIVHRDVTPANLVVAYEGDVKVLDFGIAKAERRVTHTEAGIIKGKYAYMAPEQIEGKPLDARADVWGLGATLFELITGERAFPAERDLELVEQICDHEVRAPRELRPDLPPLLEEILLNALARDREQRFRNARALGEALERWATRHTKGPVTKGRIGTFLEAVRAAVGEGLDPFGTGPAAAPRAERAPGPGAGLLGVRRADATPGPAGAISPLGASQIPRTPGPAGAISPLGGMPGPSTPGPAGAIRARGFAGLPTPVGTPTYRPEPAPPDVAGPPPVGTPGPARALRPFTGTRRNTQGPGVAWSDAPTRPGEPDPDDDSSLPTDPAALAASALRELGSLPTRIRERTPGPAHPVVVGTADPGLDPAAATLLDQPAAIAPEDDLGDAKTVLKRSGAAPAVREPSRDTTLPNPYGSVQVSAAGGVAVLSPADAAGLATTTDPDVGPGRPAGSGPGVAATAGLAAQPAAPAGDAAGAPRLAVPPAAVPAPRGAPKPAAPAPGSPSGAAEAADVAAAFPRRRSFALLGAVVAFVVTLILGAAVMVALGLHTGAAPSASRGVPPKGNDDTGVLIIRVVPFGVVTVDGAELGASPFEPARVPPGEHVLVATHPDTGKTATRNVTVAAGEQAEVNFDLR